MHPKHYRVRIFFDICRGFVFPVACLWLVVSLENIQLGRATIPCYILAIMLWAGARVYYSDFIQSRETKRLGARPIPCVVGRLPGNIDILFSMIRSFKRSYLFDPYLELFERYQATTLNMRILWTDQVSDSAPRSMARHIRLFNDLGTFILDYIHGPRSL